MIQSKRAALSVLVFLVMATPCLGKSWRGITPLKSTRADVEHLLGASTTDPPTYYFSDETVQIEYSKCRCEQKCSYDEWNVPPGTVTRIRVRLKREVKLAVLQLKLAEFEKIGDADLVDQFVLVNEKEGFAVEVGRGSVFGFIYEPLAEDKHLRCPNYKESEKPKPNCLLIGMNIDCTSEVIRVGETVQCKIRLSPMPQNSHPTLKWSVSSGGSLSGESADVVNVTLVHPTKRVVTVTAEVLSPNLCSNKASAEFRVTKDR